MSTGCLVLWSGGLDSTACLVKLLRDTDWDITTLYVDVENNRIKSWCEEQSILVMADQLTKAYRPFKMVTDNIFLKNASSMPGGLMQPNIWMLHASYASSRIAIDHDQVKVALGWIRGDDALNHLEDIKSVFAANWQVMAPDDQVPEIVLPVVNSTKRNVLNLLRTEDQKRETTIKNHIWFCETPKQIVSNSYNGYEACGECGPCERWSKLNTKETSTDLLTLKAA
jgi:7-cyano-7-deazaguanine synthase in queuosine biosynthesis